MYFLGLSLRNISRVLEPFKTENGVMCLSGIGYKDSVHCRFTEEKEYPRSL
ncbi:MAG: hypothetical protein AB7F53_02355 [Nitrososphaeraceae archaeon]